MLTSITDSCSECGGEILDMGDELVCRLCGVVSEKEVTETPGGSPIRAVDFSRQSLGSYMGPLEAVAREEFATRLAGSQSTVGYLKLISDFTGREESTTYSCLKLVERVCEKLMLPQVVRGQAMTIAKRLYSSPEERVGANSASVSAFAIITACKIERVTSVDVKEIVSAHRLMGKRVKFSSLVKLSLASPFRLDARRAEDYVQRVVARISSDENFSLNLKDRGINPGAYFIRLREASMVCLSVIEDSARGGHSPIALAAASVYAGEALLSGLEKRDMRVTQKALSERAGIAEYTLREQYGEIFRPTLRLALIKAMQIRRQ